MESETLKWQKEESFKTYKYIQQSLNFDDMKVKLTNDHQLSQIKEDITIKKFMNYCINKINNHQGLYEDGITIQGYIDEVDAFNLMQIIALITTETDKNIKKNLHKFYLYLNEIIRFYEIEQQNLDKIKEELKNLDKACLEKEKIVGEANKMVDELKIKWDKGKKRWKEFSEEFEKIMEFEDKKVEEKPLET